MPPLAMRKLGRKGRFGNQLLQYAYLRQESKGDYQCPDWLGQEIFGLNDPPIKPGTKDLTYKFPKHSTYYDEELFRSLYVPVPDFSVEIQQEVRDITYGRKLIGIHIRRGDYARKALKHKWCAPVPVGWYVQWLRKNLTEPWSVFLASDELSYLLEEFPKAFGAWSWQHKNQWDFWRDFYTLSLCDVLLTSNSTFSFTASMLAKKEVEVYRPAKHNFLRYDPWNALVVLKDEFD